MVTNSSKLDPKLLYEADIATAQKHAAQAKARAVFGGLIAARDRESRKTE